MIGLILGALAVGCICSATSDGNNSNNNNYERKYKNLEYENNYLRKENEYLKITFNNHMSLLADFDKVNQYAKSLGYKGAVAFFYYLAEIMILDLSILHDF